MTSRYVHSDSECMGNGVKLLSHSLHKTDMFSDERLIELIDQHPDEFMDICVYGRNGTGTQDCHRNGLSTSDLLEAVKMGDIWINLRHLESLKHKLAHLVPELHDSMDKILRQKSLANFGGLLISSAQSGASYHFDTTMVRLLQLRGQKRVYVYPDRKPFLSQEDVARIVYDQGSEDIYYEPAFDSSAVTIDLHPGQWVTWPLYAPHRVRNISDLNVSLTLESITADSRLKNGVHYFDEFLKRQTGTQIFTRSPSKIVQATKLLISSIIRRLVRARKPSSDKTYELALDETHLGTCKAIDHNHALKRAA